MNQGAVYAVHCVPCRYEVWKASLADRPGSSAVERNGEVAHPHRALGRDWRSDRLAAVGIDGHRVAGRDRRRSRRELEARRAA